MQRIHVLGLSLVIVLGVVGLGAAVPSGGRVELEDPAVYIVYSATDDDAQVIVSGGSNEPIKRLVVWSPDGTAIVKAKFDDGQNVGQADFLFETPEPDLDVIKCAYPSGTYVFRGRSTDGTTLVGQAELSHDLLDAPEILFPMDGETDVPVDGLVAVWNPIEGAEAIRFEIENEEEKTALKIDLPGDATIFEVPNGWLQGRVEYVLDVKAIGDNGNVTVADVRFTTSD